MQMIEVIVTNDTGIHTRPGNELVKLVKSFEGTTVELEKGDKKAKAISLLQIMSLAIKKDDVVKVYIDGGNESEIASAIQNFFINLKD